MLPIDESNPEQASTGPQAPVREIEQLVILDMPGGQLFGIQKAQSVPEFIGVPDFDLDLGFGAQVRITHTL
jgi:hypothetical protein